MLDDLLNSPKLTVQEKFHSYRRVEVLEGRVKLCLSNLLVIGLNPRSSLFTNPCTVTFSYLCIVSSIFTQ